MKISDFIQMVRDKFFGCKVHDGDTLVFVDSLGDEHEIKDVTFKNGKIVLREICD